MRAGTAVESYRDSRAVHVTARPHTGMPRARAQECARTVLEEHTVCAHRMQTCCWQRGCRSRSTPSPCSPGARPPRTRPPCTAPAWASRLSHVKVLARSSRARRAAWRAFHVKVLPCSSRARGPAWRACQSPGCACPSLSTWETRVAQTVHGWGLQNCCFSLPPAHAACRGSYTGSEGGGEEEEGATSDEGDLAELGEMNDEALARHLQQREDRAHYRRLLELAGVGARRLQHPCRALARPGEAVCVWWYRSRGQKETSMRWEQGGDSSLVQHMQQL